MKKLFYGIFCLIFLNCSPSIKKSFSKLSKPEKSWVVFHTFKAKKAYQISLEAERVKDSIKKTRTLGSDNNGGKIDAFKHSFWMARLTQGIGKRAAHSLGKAHEKGNYQTYKKRQLEDGFLPDKPSTNMDLYNNQVGIEIGKQNKTKSKNELIHIIIDSINKGKMQVLLKDKDGFFLSCNKKRIPLDSLKGKWNIKKCLVKSNYSPSQNF